MQAKLLLEDGTLFEGKAFGAQTEAVGEIVFHTGMTGYQEVMTDPSSCGQLITMTYPLIGNYGVTRDDFESVRPSIHGLVVRQYEEIPSNWRTERTLDEYLKQYNIPGISQIDTRMLTKRIRDRGSMKAILSTTDLSVEQLKERLASESVVSNPVAQVSTKQVYRIPGLKERIVVVDFGVRHGIIRELVQRGCDVVVVPYDTTPQQIFDLSPDGIILSNGPGNPKDLPEAVSMIPSLIGRVPLFGIGLGHQLFALACGADTQKMKFGHVGSNQPVLDVQTNRCVITWQNHGYVVLESSLKNTPLEITHISNHDRSVEGLKHRSAPAFSVQFHPEAIIGSCDESEWFDRFFAMIRQHQQAQPQPPKQARFATAAKKGELLYAQK